MDNLILLITAQTHRHHRLQSSLQKAGFEIQTAEGAAAAGSALRKKSPSVVLLLESPGDFDGPALVRQVLEKKPDLPVLVLAGFDSVFDYYRCGDAAVFPYPQSDGDLQAILDRIRQSIKSVPEIPLSVSDCREIREALDAERFIAVNQVLDNISLFIQQISDEVEGGVKYFNQMPYFVSVHSRELTVITANAAYRKLLGNMIGRNSWEIYRKPWANAQDCPVGRTLKSEQVQETRAVVKYRSGLRVPVIVHTAPIYNNEGEVEIVLEVSAGTRDVRRLSKQLRQSQQRYEQLFDAVPCYIAVLNRDVRITALNKPFKEAFGDATGDRFFEVFAQPAAAGTDPISRTLEDGRAHEAEMVLQKINEKRYNTLVWTSPITTAAGKLLQILVLFLDITQIRKLQNNLSSLGLMMGTIAHGIKGVLTGLNGGLYLIESGCSRGDEDKVKEGIQISRQMMQRMERVVFDILYYAKQRTLHLETLDAGAFAADVAASFEPKLRGTGIQFRIDAPAVGTFFEADTTLLRSALINVLENAAEACGTDSRKGVHGIVFQVKAEHDQICFTIVDDGPGIDSETRSKLFDLFYSTKGNRGTGLGLFITDKIIRQHGGSIAVDSESGKGARFAITLPRKVPEAFRTHRTEQILDFEFSDPVP